MPDSYIVFPIESDPQVLADEAIEALGAAIPGWEPAPGHLETWLIEILANMAAQAVTVGSTVPTAIFRAWGPLVGVPPAEATRATADTTWTAVDSLGYTITAGTLVGTRIAGDELLAWEVTADVVIPPGQTATAAGAVPVRAVEAGAAASGLSGPMELVDALSWVDSVAIVGVTGGGADAEDDDVYLSRLSRELELMSPRPILPDDFAVLAGRVAGVARATAIDGFDPQDSSTGNERMVAVAAIDSDGQPVPGGVKTQIDALLQSMREVSFIVHVIDATYTTINVTFTAVAFPGNDPADVEARAEAAVADYLSPARWGLPPTGDDTAHGGWWSQPVVRYLEVATVLNQVDGLDYVTALTINAGTSDVALAGAAPLPEPGAIAGTVT